MLAMPDSEALRSELESAAFGRHAGTLAHWLTMSDTVFGRNRREALASFPMLVAALANDPTQPALMAIAAALDRGNSMVGSVSAVIGVQEDTVRFLSGKGPVLVGSNWLDRPIELLWAIDIVSAESLPVSRDDWLAFALYWQSSCLSAWPSDYGGPAHAMRHRKFLLEHFFSGLCEAGYGAAMEPTKQVLEACAKHQYNIHDYLLFIEGNFLRSGGISNLWGKHPSSGELLLMRYPAAELVRQLHCWLELMELEEAGGAEASPESFYPVLDPNKLMRQIFTDYEDVVSFVSGLRHDA